MAKADEPGTVFILRKSGTERPFTSPLLKEHRPGIFVCVGCDQKYESGTGWPSFWAPLDNDAVGTKRDTDFSMIRTAVHCAGCGGHLGHVLKARIFSFED